MPRPQSARSATRADAGALAADQRHVEGPPELIAPGEALTFAESPRQIGLLTEAFRALPRVEVGRAGCVPISRARRGYGGASAFLRGGDHQAGQPPSAWPSVGFPPAQCSVPKVPPYPTKRSAIVMSEATALGSFDRHPASANPTEHLATMAGRHR